jgi:uncharacterized protein (TIGR00369 family)
MTAFTVQDPDFESRIRDSFARQTVNSTIGAILRSVAPGEVEIELPFRADLSQQHGFIHGGIVAVIIDSACGYAALTLSPPGAEVLTVEFKINFLAPAAGDRLVARGRVSRPGRTLTICTGDVYSDRDAMERPIATLLSTMMIVSRPQADPAKPG